MAEVGRPTIMDELTIQKLEEAFSNGASDLEACFLANISKSTLYNYQAENPGFLERKEALKDMIKFQAKKNIKEKIISGDVATSMWYAERKIKDEFSPRLENTGKDGKDLPVPILNLSGYAVSGNDRNPESAQPHEASPSLAGGNVSEQNDLDRAVSDSPGAIG